MPYEEMKCRRSRRGAMLLIGAVGASLVVLALGMFTSRRLQEARHAGALRQLSHQVEAVARSTIEEVCARLEEEHSGLPEVARGGLRDLAADRPWPAKVIPVAASRLFADHGVSVTPVTVRTWPWTYFQYMEGPDAPLLAREAGAVQLTFEVAKGPERWTVLSRRLASVERIDGRPGLRIPDVDLALEIERADER